jgi:hypothetical protein
LRSPASEDRYADELFPWSAEDGMHGNEGIGALSLVFHPLEGMEEEKEQKSYE